MSTSETAPPPAGCSYEREGDTAVVTLKPALSDVKWDQIETLGNSIETRLQSDSPKKVVFDISPLTYMGSAMVALVVRWWKTVEKAGGKSVVVCNDENVMEVLRLASLDKHWTITKTREDAFEELGARPVTGGGGGSVTHDSDDGGPGPMLPLLIGGLALPVGIVGAVMYLIQAGSPKLGLGLALGGGLTAVGGGVLAAILTAGTRRTAGIAIAVFGALIAGLAIYRLQPTDDGLEAEPVPEATPVDPDPLTTDPLATPVAEPDPVPTDTPPAAATRPAGDAGGPPPGYGGPPPGSGGPPASEPATDSSTSSSAVIELEADGDSSPVSNDP